MIHRGAFRLTCQFVTALFWRVVIGSLLLGAQHLVHKGGQAIHRRLQRIDAPVERGAGGGLGFIKLGNVLQAVTHRHLRRDPPGGVVGENLFVGQLHQHLCDFTFH